METIIKALDEISQVGTKEAWLEMNKTVSHLNRVLSSVHVDGASNAEIKVACHKVSKTVLELD